MMQEMGLYLGAIDMIKGKDGKYYFLEVNPQENGECCKRTELSHRRKNCR